MSGYLTEFQELVDGLPLGQHRNPSSPRWRPTKAMPCACVKLCSGCNEYMPITEFYVINRKNGRRDILDNYLACQCRTCEMQKFFRSDYRRLMVYRAKQNARAKNLEFNLTYEDIEIPTHCPVLGIELFTTPGRGKKNPWSYPNTPSIDRIDNSRGYVKDNIHIISMRANHLKNDATLEESKAIAAYMERHLGKPQTEPTPEIGPDIKVYLPNLKTLITTAEGVA